MKRLNRDTLSLAVACALASLVTPAFAQDAPTTDAGQKTTTLESIKVTARKREETLQDVPVAVTAFTADNLDRLNVRDLGDLDTQVPNLTIYAARATTSTVTAYLRGVGQSDPTWGSDPGVGVYLDDVYIARPQGALLDVFDVDRIEVLRGPQGTLYGKNTIGGAIKYVSRGLPAQFEGFASATIGSFRQADFKAAVGGPIGGEGSGLRGRIAVASLNRDGFGEILQTGEDLSDKKIKTARLNLGAYISENFDVQLAADFTDDNSGMRGSQLLAPSAAGAAFPPLNSRYDTRAGLANLSDFTGRGVSLTANWHANEDWTLKYVFARRSSSSRGNIDFDTTPLPIADVVGGFDDKQTSHEVQFNYDAGNRSRGVIGLYAFDGDASGVIRNNFFNRLFNDTTGSIGTKSIAAYTDWTFDLNDKLSLDIGARWTDEEKHGRVLNRSYADGTFSTPILVNANFDKTTSFKNLSPKISLDYQATPGILLYGLATRGFKSGGYNIRANATAVPRTAEPYEDEQVDSFEAGTKMALLGQRLFLNLSAFHNKYKDIQLSVFTAFDSNGDGSDDAFIGDFTNAGSGTVNGLEFEYQWLATQHFSITGNLAWLDAKYDTYLFKNVNIADQQDFTNAPDFSGAINLEYRTDVGAHGSLSMRVGYSYQSKVTATTEITRDPITGVVVQPIVQDGYGLLGAGLIWKPNATWTISLQGSNLTDKAFLTTGFVIPAVAVRTGFYGPPRQVSLGIRYDF